jgi:hypothetical protein
VFEWGLQLLNLRYLSWGFDSLRMKLKEVKEGLLTIGFDNPLKLMNLMTYNSKDQGTKAFGLY